MPCCGARDPYAGMRALSQSQRHGRKPWWGVKVVVLLLHALFIGAVFLLDPTLQRRIHEAKRYVADMLRAGSGMHATFINTAILSKKDRPVKKWKLQFCHESHCRSKIEQQNPQPPTSSSFPPVMDLYPPGSSSRWYIFEQTILAVWTVALYIHFLHLDIKESWWKGFIGSILLVALILILVVLLLLLMFHTYLALTNQTTYEIARRKRISYLRGVPSKVHPFSGGICRNLYDLCLSRLKEYVLEAVPPLDELEARARPYTCRDVICCRCC